MTTHCNQGDKPIIKYRFQGDTKDRIFKSKYAPIDVEIKEAPANATENNNREGFALKYTVTGSVEYVVTDYILFKTPSGVFGVNAPEFTYRLAWLGCGQKQYKKSTSECTGYLRYTNCLEAIVWTDNFVVDPTVKCPSPLPRRCSIIVKHKGIILLEDQGNCPVSHSVQCGKCPDGQHECESNIYPYYCCNSCGETAAKIRSLASKVGR